MADYTLNMHFKKENYAENPYLYLLNEVIRNQAKLIAKWQLVGFIHGVMNTDNMTISGETIDYGPCAFMDIYNPSTVFSSIDTKGRYAYGNQPQIAMWNLARFAETLVPLLHENQNEAIKIAENTLSKYNNLYKKYWYLGMRKKLGLFNEEEVDEYLIEALLSMMQNHNEDYTNTFRKLTIDNISSLNMNKTEEFKKWYGLWQERLSRQKESKEESKELMKKNNPIVISRNHRVEKALNAAVNDDNYDVLKALLEAITNPYDYTKNNDYYTTLPEPTNYQYRTYCGT